MPTPYISEDEYASLRECVTPDQRTAELLLLILIELRKQSEDLEEIKKTVWGIQDPSSTS